MAHNDYMVISTEHTLSRTPLLQTKLFTPEWRHGLVSRPRLIERLNQGTKRKLTLVSAPAGFGKTTLLAEWLATTADRSQSVGWVSLDSRDNDPTLFWSYVILALKGVRPGLGERASVLLHARETQPIESVLTALINEISATEEEITLVLDDFHVIDAPQIHGAVAHLLDYLPPRMHLIVASRSDPPFPLARLRGRGESTEIRAADLRFTVREATTFFSEVMGLLLSERDVSALESRTEGWIAGLQLAALSMQGRADVSEFINAFAGDDRYIVDYLVEEVLHRQPEHLRNFLLETSLLDRLSGPLCNAVTGRDDCRSLLEALDRTNLFIVPLDDKRHWYRYHHLFADVLRVRFSDEQPGSSSILHRRAAVWFEANGMLAEAIEHAGAAHEHDMVARLLAANADELIRVGQFASIARWCEALPPEMVRQRPRLALIHASAAMVTEPNLETGRRLAAWAEEAINKIEANGEFDPSRDTDGTIVGFEGLSALKGELLAQKLISGRNLGPDEMALCARQALELLPPRKHETRVIIYQILAGTETAKSNWESARAYYEQGLDEARMSGDPSAVVCVLTCLGELHVEKGKLEDGRRSYEKAIESGSQASITSTGELCRARGLLAEVLLEQGDLAGATNQISLALDLSHLAPLRSPLLQVRSTAAQTSLAAGDRVRAMEHLQWARAFASGSRKQRFASFVSSIELKIACALGDLETAATVVQERGLSPELKITDGNAEEMLSYGLYLIACADQTGAARVLGAVLRISRDGGRDRLEIQALALLALATELLGEHAFALELLGRATMLGEPGRFRRTFTNEGPVLAKLLAALATSVRGGQGPKASGSPAYLADLMLGAQSEPQADDVRSEPGNLIEPLTERELEIVRLIVAGKRNQEIADALFISVATVKRHIANAYAKMGVLHRGEAIARFSTLNLR